MQNKHTPDPTNPSHYRQHSIECIDVLEALELPFHLANVVKYIWRHRDKNGLEDLRKARWYLDRYIARETALLEATDADR